jgi:D-alanyl-lipoteichoic acid acyltransferase DltB (MBOAT superfamily)
LLLGTYAYAFQLYFDFSGYTDMALGSARLFNVRLTQNFISPYLATSVADFWRRWHISFSRWVFDYIFRPLQMPSIMRGKGGAAVALIITFLISGIWHGASWGFVIWGGLQGVYLAVAIFWKPYQKRIHKLLGLEKSWLLKVWQIAIVFNLICFSFIFFRAGTLKDAWYVVTHIFRFSSRQTSSVSDFLVNSVFLNQSSREFAVACACLVLLAFISRLAHGMKIRELGHFISDKPFLFRWGVYVCLGLGILVFGVFDTSNFIYYRF